MDLTFRKLLLSTMHIVTCKKGDPDNISDETLLKAVTVNENLHSAGYTLRPADIWMLAQSRSLDTFDREVFELVPEMKAQPMYPGFPHQVMRMSEAQFRFHQMLHYFSTYGMEQLTGGEVRKGWLPESDAPQRTVSDRRLLEDTVLELADENEAAVICVERLFSRRERLTQPQLELVMLCLPQVPEEALMNIRILFKENLELVFPSVFEKMTRKDAVRILHHLCAHTGDVLNCISLLLKKNRHHLRTAQKRMLVQLLESYGAADFRGNLILSNAKRERNLEVLAHLDYSKYSRSTAHRKAVSELRGKQLHSWESIAERKIRGHEEDALGFIAKRPGIMLRKLNLLLLQGYEEQDIAEHLCVNARALSAQTLVKLLSEFRTGNAESVSLQKERELRNLEWEYENLYDSISPDHIQERYARLFRMEHDRHAEAVMREKQRLEKELEDLSPEKISKACSGELQILEEAMLEPYLNLMQGNRRHASILENSLKNLKNRISFLEAAQRQRANDCAAMARRRECSEKLLARLREDEKRLLKELSDLLSLKEVFLQQNGWDRESMQIREKYDRILENLPAQAARLRTESDARCEELEQRHARNYQRIEASFWQDLQAASAKRKDLPMQFEKKREDILKKYDLRLRSLSNYSALKRILTQALQAHFKSIDTVLRGKRIYLDDGGFDLKHSLMKAMDKSKDSTYVNSGFAWRIPEGASGVRFFVYWNDSRRVDIDLHASAAAQSAGREELTWLHVGWNGDFRSSGVVHSGDITHSDAAEYIDVNLDSPVRYVTMNIDLFSGRDRLCDVEECFTGLMAVGDDSETVKLYDPANCFFTHTLRQKAAFMHYGYIDVKERYVRFTGSPDRRDFSSALEQDPPEAFYVQEYLELLLQGQDAQLAGSREEADLILSVAKAKEEGAVSLIDSNYFLDAC